MIDAFLLRTTLAGVGVALTAAPLGCFVLWRRMVYFGDTISHAALLGVALALALNLPVVLGVLILAMVIASVILTAENRVHHTDTLLGVAAHSALALGLVAVSLQTSVRVDLMSYLIGDILSVNWQDVAIIWGGGVVCLGLIIWRWNALLLSSLNRELALAQGQNPRRESVFFTLALAILIAVSLKIVGALLITAMLIIPAAAARFASNSPERMAIWAAISGVMAVFLGVAGSFRLDTPTGPSIVVAALIILLAVAGLKSIAGAFGFFVEKISKERQ